MMLLWHIVIRYNFQDMYLVSFVIKVVFEFVLNDTFANKMCAVCEYW